MDNRRRVRIVFYDMLILNCFAGIVGGIAVLINILNYYAAIAGIFIVAICSFIMVEAINKRCDLVYNDDDSSYMDDWD